MVLPERIELSTSPLPREWPTVDNQSDRRHPPAFPRRSPPRPSLPAWAARRLRHRVGRGQLPERAPQRFKMWGERVSVLGTHATDDIGNRGALGFGQVDQHGSNIGYGTGRCATLSQSLRPSVPRSPPASGSRSPVAGAVTKPSPTSPITPFGSASRLNCRHGPRISYARSAAPGILN